MTEADKELHDVACALAIRGCDPTALLGPQVEAIVNALIASEVNLAKATRTVDRLTKQIKEAEDHIVILASTKESFKMRADRLHRVVRELAYGYTKMLWDDATGLYVLRISKEWVTMIRSEFPEAYIGRVK